MAPSSRAAPPPTCWVPTALPRRAKRYNHSMSRGSWHIAILLGFAGCGARSLGASDSSSDGVIDGVGVDASDRGIALDPTMVCAMPAACNDDPSMSGLAGTCKILTSPSSAWYCDCAQGFSVNPKTGLCRAGSACVAAGADQWALSVRLGPTNCATRPESSCAPVAGTADDQVTAAIGKLVVTDCQFPELVHLRVELISGCPTLFELDKEPANPSLLNCLEKVLLSSRWSCAGDSACALFEYDTLP